MKFSVSICLILECLQYQTVINTTDLDIFYKCNLSLKKDVLTVVDTVQDGLQRES